MKISRLIGTVFVYSCMAISSSVGAATTVDTLEDIGADGSVVNYRNIGGILAEWEREEVELLMQERREAERGRRLH